MDQMKSDFVSMVSHEIRSPMNSVLMQLKVILDGLAGETTAKQREILGEASERITALTTLVSELLDLAKIESGLITREREEIRIDALLADQVAFHQAAAQAKSIQLKSRASAGFAGPDGQPAQPGRSFFKPYRQCHQLHP
jgi:two-component system phosphate regulon sensor histidine kinase PhoR